MSQMYSWSITSNAWIRIWQGRSWGKNLQSACYLLALLHDNAGFVEIMNSRMIGVYNHVRFTCPNELIVRHDIFRQVIVLNCYNGKSVRLNAWCAGNGAELRPSIVSVNIDWQILEQWHIPFFGNQVSLHIRLLFLISHHGQQHVTSQCA